MNLLPIGQALCILCTVMFIIYEGHPEDDMTFFTFSHLVEWLQLIIVPHHYIGLFVYGFNSLILKPFHGRL